MYGRYNTHFFCSLCRNWYPREGGNVCPICNRVMRSRPKDSRQKELFLIKYPLHKGRNIK